jgi:hypothetical protein
MMWTIPTPWGPIMFHFCPQEMMVLLMMIPFMGGLIAWVRRKFKKHEKQEDAKHASCCKHEEGKK